MPLGARIRMGVRARVRVRARAVASSAISFSWKALYRRRRLTVVYLLYIYNPSCVIPACIVLKYLQPRRKNNNNAFETKCQSFGGIQYVCQWNHDGSAATV